MDRPTPPAPAKVIKSTKKDWKGQGKVPSNLLHTRVSYLYQAATYLSIHSGKNSDNSEPIPTGGETENTASLAQEKALKSTSRLLISDLREVAQKQLIRVSPAMKLSICKNCDSLLIDGSTCSTEVENKSKGGKKPWANVLVRKCNTCSACKRIPLGERQTRRPQRSTLSQTTAKSP